MLDDFFDLRTPVLPSTSAIVGCFNHWPLESALNDVIILRVQDSVSELHEIDDDAQAFSLVSNNGGDSA